MDGLTLLILIVIALFGLFLFFKVLKFIGKLIFTLLLLAGIIYFWARFHPQSFNIAYSYVKGFWK